MRVSSFGIARHVGTDRRGAPVLPGDGGAQRTARACDPRPARSHPDWRSPRRRRRRPNARSPAGPPGRTESHSCSGSCSTPPPGDRSRRHRGLHRGHGSRRRRRTRRPWSPTSPGRWRGLSSDAADRAQVLGGDRPTRRLRTAARFACLDVGWCPASGDSHSQHGGEHRPRRHPVRSERHGLRRAADGPSSSTNFLSASPSQASRRIPVTRRRGLLSCPQYSLALSRGHRQKGVRHARRCLRRGRTSRPRRSSRSDAHGRRAATGRAGLQAGAEPLLVGVLQLRHQLLHHLHPGRLLHHLLQRVERRRSGRHRLGLAHPGLPHPLHRPVPVRAGVRLPHLGRHLLVGLQARRRESRVLHGLAQPDRAARHHRLGRLRLCHLLGPDPRLLLHQLALGQPRHDLPVLPRRSCSSPPWSTSSRATCSRSSTTPRCGGT